MVLFHSFFYHEFENNPRNPWFLFITNLRIKELSSTPTVCMLSLFLSYKMIKDDVFLQIIEKK